jgi:hypothetical protein
MQSKPIQHAWPVALGLIVALFVGVTVFPASAVPFRAACGTSNGSVKSVSISSQVTGDRVRVCADWLKVSTGQGSSSSKKPSLKPSSPSTGSSASSAGKVAVTPLNRSVVATATRPNILAVPNASIAAKTSVLFLSDATRHTKIRQLLGYHTLIRFTPIAYRWTMGDSIASNRSRVRHKFNTTGLYFVRLSVTYSIDLKVLPAGKWIATPLTIKKVADPYQVRVGQTRIIQGIPVFVIRDCHQMPGAIGC